MESQRISYTSFSYTKVVKVIVQKLYDRKVNATIARDMSICSTK